MTRQRLTDKDLTPAIIAAAVKLRADGLCAGALGTERELTIEGVRYVAVVEEHYHEPGGKLRPWGKHHGISMFRVMEDPMSLLRGCDVSDYQLPTLVDWSTQDFGIVKATDGKRRMKRTVEHVQRIRSAGKLVGLYHFLRSDQSVEAQADAFGLALQECGGIDIAPALDVEDYPGHKIGPDDAQTASAFLDRFPGVQWMIYISNQDWLRMGKPSWMLDHPLWVPHYPANGSTSLLKGPSTPNGAAWRIWQCRVGPLDRALQHDKHPKAVDQNLAVDPLPRYGEFAPPAPRKRPTLRLGDEGDDVAAMQRLLNVKADGKFGLRTLAALKVFQEDHGLTADGICGPKTWVALGLEN